jgi:hypothetical protein
VVVLNKNEANGLAGNADRTLGPLGMNLISRVWIRNSATSLVLLLPLVLAGTAKIVRAQSDENEYRVKAAFLFHFAQLVDWPPDALSGADNSLYLCTLAEDPFQGALESTVEGKTIGKRVIHIRHLQPLDDMRKCHLVFFGKDQSKRIRMLLANLRNAPVLTVGETADFLADGGMISFLLDEDRVRFDINLGAARSAGLTIGARLLVLAKNVTGQSQEK